VSSLENQDHKVLDLNGTFWVQIEDTNLKYVSWGFEGKSLLFLGRIFFQCFASRKLTGHPNQLPNPPLQLRVTPSSLSLNPFHRDQPVTRGLVGLRVEFGAADLVVKQLCQKMMEHNGK
jgi:hypothetical protein